MWFPESDLEMERYHNRKEEMEPVSFNWSKRRHELRKLARDFALTASNEVEPSPGLPQPTASRQQKWFRTLRAETGASAAGLPKRAPPTLLQIQNKE